MSVKRKTVEPNEAKDVSPNILGNSTQRVHSILAKIQSGGDEKNEAKSESKAVEKPTKTTQNKSQGKAQDTTTTKIEETVKHNPPAISGDVSESEFEAFLRRVKESEVSDKTKVAYIDSEIHSLLAMLKMRGIPITKLLNTVLIDWIEANQEDITNLVKTENRFL